MADDLLAHANNTTDDQDELDAQYAQARADWTTAVVAAVVVQATAIAQAGADERLRQANEQKTTSVNRTNFDTTYTNAVALLDKDTAIARFTADQALDAASLIRDQADETARLQIEQAYEQSMNGAEGDRYQGKSNDAQSFKSAMLGRAPVTSRTDLNNLPPENDSTAINFARKGRLATVHQTYANTEATATELYKKAIALLDFNYDTAEAIAWHNDSLARINSENTYTLAIATLDQTYDLDTANEDARTATELASSSTLYTAIQTTADANWLDANYTQNQTAMAGLHTAINKDLTQHLKNLATTQNTWWTTAGGSSTTGRGLYTTHAAAIAAAQATLDADSIAEELARDTTLAGYQHSATTIEAAADLAYATSEESALHADELDRIQQRYDQQVGNDGTGGQVAADKIRAFALAQAQYDLTLGTKNGADYTTLELNVDTATADADYKTAVLIVEEDRQQAVTTTDGNSQVAQAQRDLDYTEALYGTYDSATDTLTTAGTLTEIDINTETLYAVTEIAINTLSSTYDSTLTTLDVNLAIDLTATYSTAISGMTSTVWSDRAAAIAAARATEVSTTELAWQTYNTATTVAYDAEETTSINANRDEVITSIKEDAIAQLKTAQATLDKAISDAANNNDLANSGSKRRG